MGSEFLGISPPVYRRWGGGVSYFRASTGQEILISNWTAELVVFVSIRASTCVKTYMHLYMAMSLPWGQSL